MIVFDSDIVTHLSYANPRLLRRIEQSDETKFAISVITRYECLRGRIDSLLKAADEDEFRIAVDRYQRTEKILLDFEILDFDDAAIQHFG